MGKATTSQTNCILKPQVFQEFSEALKGHELDF